MIDTFQRYIYSYNFINKKKKARKKKLKVIDVGANNLGLAKYIDFQKIDLTLLDVKEFLPKIKKNNRSISFVTYNGKKMPFKDNSFDIVVSSDTLEHIPPNKRKFFLTELIRICAKDLIITFPTRKALQFEQILDRLYFFKNSFLNEHRNLGLPKETIIQNNINMKKMKIKNKQKNINLYLWLLIKPFSSLIVQLDRLFPFISKYIFHFHRLLISKIINFGKCYSITIHLVRNE
jgi:SAM-dependent methyltransferase